MPLTPATTPQDVLQDHTQCTPHTCQFCGKIPTLDAINAAVAEERRRSRTNRLYHDPNVLAYLYYGRMMSMEEIARVLGTCRSEITEWMDHHGIPRRDRTPSFLHVESEDDAKRNFMSFVRRMVLERDEHHWRRYYGR